jgi:hypothetical protein
MDHPLTALGWVVCCFAIAWTGYRRTIWRIGHLRAGRFLGNTIGVSGYLLGLFGAGILWPTLFESGGRYAATQDASWWTWSRAFSAASVVGVIGGATLTWLRRPKSYRYDAARLRPWLDDVDLEMKALAEAEGDTETCRELAAELRAEAERRRAPLPQDLMDFVQRYEKQGKIST